MKIAVGISGSSSVELGVLLLEKLQIYALNAEIYAVLSEGAKRSFAAENKALNLQNNEVLEYLQENFKLERVVFYEDNALDAPLCSGSFGVSKTLIAPCSLNTLAKINAGFADTLLTRMSAVALKERKTLVLGVREMPFSTLALEQMTRLSQMGVIIASPVYAGYSGAKNLQDLQNFFIGKWLDLLEIKHDLFTRWQG